MTHKYSVREGTYRGRNGMLQKLRLFFIVGGKEIPQYNILREGLVRHADCHKTSPPAHDLASEINRLAIRVRSSVYFETELEYCKVFVSQEGQFKQFYSFYLQFVQPPKKIVTIRPFDPDSPLMFRGSVRFLTKAEVMQLIDPTSTSATFYLAQSTLPRKVLENMITVQEKTIRGQRKIRIIAN